MIMRKKELNKNALIVTFLAIIVLIIAVSLSFNFLRNDKGNSNKKSLIEAQREDLMFEQAVQESHLIIEGVFVGEHLKDGYCELEFTVGNTYLGDYNDLTIMVYTIPDVEFIDEDTFYIIEGDQYEKNESYLLFLRRIVSVYYDTDRYVSVGEIVFPMNEPEAATMLGESISSEAQYFLTSIQTTSNSRSNRSVIEINPEVDFVGVEYTETTELSEIAQYAEYAIRVRIGEYVYSSDSLGTTAYTCKVIDTYSGNVSDDEIIVNFFDGTVVEGEEYIILVNRAGEDSLVYPLAAKENSVLKATQDNINSVKEYISE